MTTARILNTLAFAAACALPAVAHAQSGAPADLNEMRALLEAQARRAVALMGHGCTPGRSDKTSPDGDGGPCKPQPAPTFTQLLSFVPLQFGLTGAPQVKYDLVPGYALYAARCRPAATGMMGLNQPGGRPGPTVGYIAPNVSQVLPPAPALSGDSSARIEIRHRVDLGVLPPPAQYANPIVYAWGEGVAQGSYRVTSTTPVLPSGQPPTLGAGVLVVAVTPWFDLQDADYQATVIAGEALVNGTQRVAVPFLPNAFTVVGGQLKGGRWAQGSGLLFIPAPAAVATGACPANQVFTQPADAALLARFGIQPGQPFARPGATFVRTTTH